jgi:hypothetical protein
MAIIELVDAPAARAPEPEPAKTKGRRRRRRRDEGEAPDAGTESAPAVSEEREEDRT